MSGREERSRRRGLAYASWRQEEETMALQHRDWVAILDRRVHIFDVMGYITSLDIPLQGGGGYYVTTGAELEKSTFHRI
jgi:hypothetical protein